MRIGLWNTYEDLNVGERLFDSSFYTIGYGLEQYAVQFRKLGAAHACEVRPYEKGSDPREWGAVVFFDYPSVSPQLPFELAGAGVPVYLVVFESRLHNPDNWVPEKTKPFRMILSYRRYPDDPRYVYSPVPQALAVSHSNRSWTQRKFSCVIAGNKDNTDPQSLYGERKRIIRWYERHAPQQLDLFGTGWDAGEPVSFGRWFHWTRHFPSFCGRVADKRATLEQYRFAFCLENVSGESGYVTEKLFDAVASGCVPIYSGANDSRGLFPEGMYLEYRDFRSMRQMHRFLEGFTANDYEAMMSVHRKFVSDPQSKQYSAEGFAERLLSVVMS